MALPAVEIDHEHTLSVLRQSGRRLTAAGLADAALLLAMQKTPAIAPRRCC
jgi:hypothetical protein